MEIATVVGARPQFIKAASISREISQRPSIKESIIHTGQHFDRNMSEDFFSDLEIPEPVCNLAIHGGGHGEMTGKMLVALENKFLDLKPDVVLLYGDTNSTLAGALSASKLNIPIAHVEAGLRSYNRKMPEEINRLLTDHMSSILFCPTHRAVSNLSDEGIVNNVFHVGDVMYDAALFAKQKLSAIKHILDDMRLSPREYSLATIHRAENTDCDDRLQKIFNLLNEEANIHPVIMPLHPRTKKVLQSNNVETGNIVFIDPVGYFEIQELLAHAQQLFTDSGGLQKEAYFYRVPCTTLRDETEWVETIESGWNKLWTDKDWSSPRVEITDYGDGRASRKIVDRINGLVTN